jgi:hypothetical protein
MGIELAVHHRFSIHIHGCGHIRVPHHSLLYADRSSNGIEPTTKRVPEGMPTQPRNPIIFASGRR